MSSAMSPQQASFQRPTLWRPNPGGQSLFWQCPFWEVLGDGNRGGGKTDVLIWDFTKGVGKGYGPAWRGILFRVTFPQLAEVEMRTRLWFPKVFRGAKYNKGSHEWTFADGEQLLLRYLGGMSDYWEYHGWQVPWIGFEELVNWRSSEAYESMLTCSRTMLPNMPRRVRSTTNSYGPGHSWVKRRFIDPAPAGYVHGERGSERCRVPMYVEENTPFLEANPYYLQTLDTISDENKRKSWRSGSWDIVSGAFFSSAWDPDIHVIPAFAIPDEWDINRSHDWGSAKPFCTLWYAESNGEEVMTATGMRSFPRGTLFVIAEDYGTAGNEEDGWDVGVRLDARGIARRVKIEEACHAWGDRVIPGPADDPVFDAGRHGYSMADEMADEDVYWEKPEKGPGSRITGWQHILSMLEASKQSPMEVPGIFIFNACRHLIRTLPTLLSDPKKPDDIDTTQEDHPADCLRLRVLAGTPAQGGFVPMRGF